MVCWRWWQLWSSSSPQRLRRPRALLRAFPMIAMRSCPTSRLIGPSPRRIGAASTRRKVAQSSQSRPRPRPRLRHRPRCHQPRYPSIVLPALPNGRPAGLPPRRLGAVRIAAKAVQPHPQRHPCRSIAALASPTGLPAGLFRRNLGAALMAAKGVPLRRPRPRPLQRQRPTIAVRGLQIGRRVGPLARRRGAASMVVRAVLLQWHRRIARLGLQIGRQDGRIPRRGGVVSTRARAAQRRHAPPAIDLAKRV